MDCGRISENGYAMVKHLSGFHKKDMEGMERYELRSTSLLLRSILRVLCLAVNGFSDACSRHARCITSSTPTFSHTSTATSISSPVNVPISKELSGTRTRPIQKSSSSSCVRLKHGMLLRSLDIAGRNMVTNRPWDGQDVLEL